MMHNHEIWVFCLECGQAYKTNDMLIQFCSKGCLDKWSNGSNSKHVSIVANYGQKDNSKYLVWRKGVLSRDGNICRCCNKTSNNFMHAHHIVLWSHSSLLRYVVSNGITLCQDCHSIIHGFKVGRTMLNTDINIVSLIRKKYILEANIRYKV